MRQYDLYVLIHRNFKSRYKNQCLSQTNTRKKNGGIPNVLESSEEMLKRIPTDGAFLVRPSERESNCYAISFRYVFLKRFFSCFFFITFCNFRFCIAIDNISLSYTNICISNQILLL